MSTSESGVASEGRYLSVLLTAALVAVQTLSMLISNILQNPADPKYRSFKSQNARIQRTVLSLSGGQAYLLLAGFGTRTTDFKQEWFVSTAVQPVAGETPSQLQDFRWRKLELAHRVLRERLADSEDRAQREVERKQREEDFEKNRARRALDEAREDRDRVALRAERESLARRLAAEKEAKKSNSRDAESGAQPRDDGDGVYSGDSQQQQQPPESSGITQDDYTREIPFDEPSHRASGAEGDEEEADSGGEAPPPYGREHLGSGRRLGGP